MLQYDTKSVQYLQIVNITRISLDDPYPTSEMNFFFDSSENNSLISNPNDIFASLDK